MNRDQPAALRGRIGAATRAPDPHTFMAEARDYPEDVVHKALELAAVIGIRGAGRQLEISEATIRNWTKNPAYSERWAELRRINAPKWRERAAVSLEELVDSYAEKLATAVEKSDAALEKMEPRDLANFIRSIAVAQGVAADHVAKLRGQPTQIHEHVVNADQLTAAMHKILQEGAIDATSEEITPAELAPAADPAPE